MHIDMKLNFMHILAKLGFDGVYPIYWIKESKHAIGYIYSKYAWTRLSRTKVQQVNKAKPMSKNEFKQNTYAQRLILF